MSNKQLSANERSVFRRAEEASALASIGMPKLAGRLVRETIVDINDVDHFQPETRHSLQTAVVRCEASLTDLGRVMARQAVGLQGEGDDIMMAEVGVEHHEHEMPELIDRYTRAYRVVTAEGQIDKGWDKVRVKYLAGVLTADEFEEFTSDKSRISEASPKDIIAKRCGFNVWYRKVKVSDGWEYREEK